METKDIDQQVRHAAEGVSDCGEFIRGLAGPVLASGGEVSTPQLAKLIESLVGEIAKLQHLKQRLDRAYRFAKMNPYR